MMTKPVKPSRIGTRSVLATCGKLRVTKGGPGIVEQCICLDAGLGRPTRIPPMGALSPVHLAVVAVLALLLFGGKGKISSLMGDAAQGIKAFKKGLSDDEHGEGETNLDAQIPRTDREKADLRPKSH
jgi:sec-independent protein translocase protein TatA